MNHIQIQKSDGGRYLLQDMYISYKSKFLRKVDYKSQGIQQRLKRARYLLQDIICEVLNYKSK